MTTPIILAPPPLFLLLIIAGASGSEWSVNYNQLEICALNGSTVFMNGTFTLPEHLTVKETFWFIDTAQGVTDLSKVPDYSGRVKYFTDKQKHFPLKLSNVMKKDEHKYLLRITTDVENQKWMGKPAVNLKVTELHVKSPGEVTEGQSADLTCKTTCSLIDPTFIWYKNGRSLSTKTIKNNQLHLQTVSSEDAGRYSCAVRGSEHLPSTAQTLRVRYPPKSVSVSISPSGEIVEGSSVTLTCSSDANPPVKNYTWFKGSSSEGKGETYSIPNISSEDSGGYTCHSRNELGEKSSTAVYLNVLYPPRMVSVSISSSDEIIEDNSVNLTCSSSDANPPVEIYNWFKEGESSPVGSGHTYSPLQSGSYYCQAQNRHGAQRSAAKQVIFKDHSAILYTCVGVGVCGIAAFLTVVFCMRRKRQNRNMEDHSFGNIGHNPSSSIPDYINVEVIKDNAHPSEDDASSIPDYESIESDEHNFRPSDDDVSSIPDYLNVEDLRKHQ